MTTSSPTPVESGAIGREPASVEQLEQEGDLAADFIEELLDIADIDGDLALDVRAGRAYVSVEADDPGALRLLSDHDTVQALQVINNHGR